MMKRVVSLVVILSLMICGAQAFASGVTASGGFYKSKLFENPDGEYVSVGMENALEKGRQYMDYMPFSYRGLVEQLKFEGFTHTEAVYACDIIFEVDELPLAKGSNGKKVKEVQERLIKWGFLDGGADGIFGSGTQAAVKAFQADRGLDETGVVDQNTYSELLLDPQPKEAEINFDWSIYTDEQLEVIRDEVIAELESRRGSDSPAE